MRIEQLIYLNEIAKTNSISISAENLFVSQPAISSAINKLEEELGSSLFTRSKNGVYLTPFGQEILEEAKVVLKHIENIQDIAHRQKMPEYKKLQGTFSIQMPPPFSIWVFGNIIHQLKEHFPLVTFQCQENDPSTIKDSSNSLKYDLNILPIFNHTFDHTENKVAKNENISSIIEKYIKDCPHLKADMIFSTRLFVSVSVDSPLAKKKSISLKELASLPLGSLNYAYDSTNYIQQLFDESVKLNIVFSTNNFYHLLDQIKKGECVSTSNSLQPNIPGLTLIPISDSCKMKYYAVYNADNKFYPVITDFLNLTKKFCYFAQ